MIDHARPCPVRWQLSESVIDSIAASYKAKAVYDLAHSQTQAAMVAAASALTAARGAQLRAEKALREHIEQHGCKV